MVSYGSVPPPATSAFSLAASIAPPIAFVAIVVLAACQASCQSAVDRANANVDISSAEIPASPTIAVAPLALPDPCVDFLSQLTCWLRAAGNSPADVDRAVGNARARFEARPNADEACEAAMVYRHELLGAAGCAHAFVDPLALPTSAIAECPPGEYFFVRRDGHVSGCHRDCSLRADCPEGSSCTATGSAAGGPIDEHFCE
jgi:hypothetical protein